MKNINDMCGDFSNELPCGLQITSPLYSMYPCSWNHRLSVQLPKQNVSEGFKVILANLLFFIVLLETIPIAFSLMQTYKKWKVYDYDDGGVPPNSNRRDFLYNLRLNVIIAVLTKIFILFYGVIISNFFLIYAACVTLFFYIIYIILIIVILRDNNKTRKN
jgi:hypothetical protein